MKNDKYKSLWDPDNRFVCHVMISRCSHNGRAANVDCSYFRNTINVQKRMNLGDVKGNIGREKTKKIDDYFKNNPTQRGYRKRMMKIWTKSSKTNPTSQRLADQARLILKKERLAVWPWDSRNMWIGKLWIIYSTRHPLTSWNIIGKNKITAEPKHSQILTQETRCRIIKIDHEWTEDYITIPKEILEWIQVRDWKSKLSVTIYPNGQHHRTERVNERRSKTSQKWNRNPSKEFKQKYQTLFGNDARNTIKGTATTSETSKNDEIYWNWTERKDHTKDKGRQVWKLNWNK